MSHFAYWTLGIAIAVCACLALAEPALDYAYNWPALRAGVTVEP
jgi:hypothetical protein